MLSFIWNEIHLAYYWKFFAFNARSFFISFHIVYIQKNHTTLYKLHFLQERRVCFFGFVSDSRESLQFGYLAGYRCSSDVDPTVTAIFFGFYERGELWAEQCWDRVKVERISERTVPRYHHGNKDNVCVFHGI